MSLENYVEVKDRVTEFYNRYPEGSIQSEYEYRTVGDRLEVVVIAHAYRTPDDERPATGLASERIPGTTSFTRDSELETAQTSAWGRAMGALGIGIQGAIATRDEVNAKEAPKLPERVKVERRKSEDPTIKDDPWASGSPAFGEQVQAIADQLGAEVVTVKEDALRGPLRNLKNSKGSASEKQRGFARRLIVDTFPEAVDDASVFATAQEVLNANGRGPLGAWEELSSAQASYLIELCKGGGK